MDVNGNGALDELVLDASMFDLDIEALLLDGADFDLLTVIGLGTPVVDITGSVSVSSATLTLGGLVRDVTADPPFTLELDLLDPLTIDLLPSAAVPEPPLLALLGSGGLVVLLAGRRKRHV